MDKLGKLMNSDISRWVLLAVAPVVLLLLSRAIGMQVGAWVLGLALTWVMAAIFLGWGNNRAKLLSKSLVELESARSELKEALGQIRESARNDSLTGAANQGFMYEILRQEWGRAERSGSPLSMVLTEFDGFERYVDNYGDHAGHRLLRQAAETISQEIKRPGDLLARLGGNRFVVLLPDTDLEGAALIAEHLRESIELHTVGTDAQAVTISAGVVVRMPSSQNNESELLEMARSCVAAAKQAGGNRIFTQDQLR